MSERFYHVTAAGLILVPLSFFLLAVAAVIYEGPAALVDRAQSFWLAIHVGVSLIGYAAFALAFATGFFYVVQEDLYETVRAGPSADHGPGVALGTGLGAYIGYLVADPTALRGCSGHRVYAYSRADWTV